MHFLHHLQKVWILFKFGYLKKSKRLDFLRHSHASLLIQMGFPILAVSERLGHEKIQTTLQLYSHLYPDVHGSVATQLEERSGADLAPAAWQDAIKSMKA